MKLFERNKQKMIDNPPSRSVKNFERGMNSVTDIIAPSSIEVDFGHIRVGESFHKTFFVVGYPRFVSPNWLEPLIDFDHSLNISMFCYPTTPADVLSDLRRKIAEMEATLQEQTENNKVLDPNVQAALEDALSVQEEIAKGIERFFQFSLYITLVSQSLLELEEASKRLKTLLSSILILAKPATLQMEDGFKSTVPIADDQLFLPRNMDTTSLASTFPFTSATLTQDKGVMYGINQLNGSLIIFDRFSLENANEVVFGKSGAGKSYLIKLELMRQFMFGTEVIVIDPEGEYGELTRALGGEYVQFSPASLVKINPFDLTGRYEEGENELGLKILSLHALLRIVMGELDASHDAILDRALVETYRQKGITPDPATQKKEPPLMEDLYKALLGNEDPISQDLALRLEKFIKGSMAGIFNQQSNFDIKNPLTAFSTRGLEDQLRPVAMHIILDFIWTRVRKDLKKRLLVLDEAWYLMKYQDSASFVHGIAKRARKYYLALTTATQDVQDFLSTDYGKAILSNSSIQVLLKQSPTEIDLVSEIFYLSEQEKQLLLSANVGEGLFFAGQSHVSIKVLAAPFEHSLITSNPEELLKRQEEEAVMGGSVPPIQNFIPPVEQNIQTTPLQNDFSSALTENKPGA
ncbi:MAG: ATP-binding protein [Candidatus Levybacteria bacterium]|nr:ATP-binding protein [Candidatus Levybacteria bacterium]